MKKRMNMTQEKINIAELLKNCPKGTKLYSPAYGEVELLKETIDIPIMVADKYGNKFSFNFHGGISLHGECLLFPSKEVRDWGCFRVKYAWGGDGNLNSVRVKKVLLDNGGTDLSDGVWACGDPMALYYINAITHEICVACTESEKAYILSTGTELKLEEEQPQFKVGGLVVNVDRLIKNYEIAVNAIAELFLNKQFGADEEPPIKINDGDFYWAGDEVGDILCYGDTYFYAFDDVLTDIKENAPIGELDKYNDWKVRCIDLGLKPNCNYRSWLKGAPRVPESTLKRLEDMKAELEEETKKVNKQD